MEKHYGIKKDMRVAMFIEQDGQTVDITGTTIEDVATAPSFNGQDKNVVRVRWDDGSETIENVKFLIAAG